MRVDRKGSIICFIKAINDQNVLKHAMHSLAGFGDAAAARIAFFWRRTAEPERALLAALLRQRPFAHS
jgi:hypothetical protein